MSKQRTVSKKTKLGNGHGYRSAALGYGIVLKGEKTAAKVLEALQSSGMRPNDLVQARKISLAETVAHNVHTNRKSKRRRRF